MVKWLFHVPTEHPLGIHTFSYDPGFHLDGLVNYSLVRMHFRLDHCILVDPQKNSSYVHGLCNFIPFDELAIIHHRNVSLGLPRPLAIILQRRLAEEVNGHGRSSTREESIRRCGMPKY